MTGERNLAVLIRDMEPALDPLAYGFAASDGDRPDVGCFARIAEAEGITLVAPTAALLAAGLEAGTPFARITLTVHSALEAVGLTAAFAGALAQEGISANVIAGFHHDHIFVPWADRDRAMATLKALAARGA